ncbi:hypothetical protein FOF52_05150 [Thermobifida alba]|uniref:Lipoprotein n=1 Tax=Thermobifida alba TaxID=53522 RepID=A0ABY4KYB4_THEAE|nr:hypothetical protein [Thermobifida alba]UPT20428.1 hypothetical protein FOF52_05150 [Thermobifida alba]
MRERFPATRPRPVTELFGASRRPATRLLPARADFFGSAQEPDPRRATTPAAFVSAMRHYRAWVGSPSYLEMEYNCGGVCSASRFRLTLNSDRLPRLTVLNAFVVACGGGEADYQRWAAAWRRVRTASGNGTPS